MHGRKYHLIEIWFINHFINVAIDGSEDDDIYIKDLDDFRVDSDESGDCSNESDEEEYVDSDKDDDTSDGSESENEGCKYDSSDDPITDD